MPAAHCVQAVKEPEAPVKYPAWHGAQAEQEVRYMPELQVTQAGVREGVAVRVRDLVLDWEMVGEAERERVLVVDTVGVRVALAEVRVGVAERERDGDRVGEGRQLITLAVAPAAHALGQPQGVQVEEPGVSEYVPAGQY